MRTLGFTPSAAARELVGRSASVGLLLAPGVRRYTPYFVLLLEALSEALAQDGLRVKEVATDPYGLPPEEAMGYILLGAYPGVFAVAPDDVDGGYQATRHLLQLGHEAAAHLTGHLHHQAGRERLLGYRKALEERGLPFRPELVLDGTFDPLAAYRAVRRAWEGGLRFTALFAASDEMALGAKAALEDLGLRVPWDVSLVGYDDLPEIGEGLTTVHQDIPTIAQEAVALLKEALSGGAPVGKRVPVRLVVRGTSMPREVGARETR